MPYASFTASTYSVGPMAPVESDGTGPPPSASVSPAKFTGTGGPAGPAFPGPGDRPRTCAASLALAARYAASFGSRAVRATARGPGRRDGPARLVGPYRRRPSLVKTTGWGEARPAATARTGSVEASARQVMDDTTSTRAGDRDQRGNGAPVPRASERYTRRKETHKGNGELPDDGEPSFTWDSSRLPRTPFQGRRTGGSRTIGTAAPGSVRTPPGSSRRATRQLAAGPPPDRRRAG